jgi:tRNA(Ile2) C34 agmatinyltransferase TiaS
MFKRLFSAIILLDKVLFSLWILSDKNLEELYDLIKMERKKRKHRKKIKGDVIGVAQYRSGEVELITEKDTKQFNNDVKALETGLDIQDINNLTK